MKLIHYMPITILLRICVYFSQLWEDLCDQACVISNYLLNQLHNNYTMSSSRFWLGRGWLMEDELNS